MKDTFPVTGKVSLVSPDRGSFHRSGKVSFDISHCVTVLAFFIRVQLHEVEFKQLMGISKLNSKKHEALLNGTLLD